MFPFKKILSNAGVNISDYISLYTFTEWKYGFGLCGLMYPVLPPSAAFVKLSEIAKY